MLDKSAPTALQSESQKGPAAQALKESVKCGYVAP